MAWPSGSVAGIPSTSTRTPRTPNCALEPKPRTERRSPIARLKRLWICTPGIARSASSRKAPAVPRVNSEPVTTETECGVPVPTLLLRTLTSTGSIVTVESGSCAQAGAVNTSVEVKMTDRTLGVRSTMRLPLFLLVFEITRSKAVPM